MKRSRLLLVLTMTSCSLVMVNRHAGQITSLAACRKRFLSARTSGTVGSTVRDERQ